jgi:hypothetical protein
MIFITILFLGTIATNILLLRANDANFFLYAQAAGNFNYSDIPSCLRGTPSYTNMTLANGSGMNISKSVNITSGTDTLVPGKKVNSTVDTTVANVSVGKGELSGTSKAVKPQANLIPQSKEPVMLVPNLTAFQEAKNQVNSPCPQNELITNLENKNVVEPPIVPTKK